MSFLSTDLRSVLEVEGILLPADGTGYKPLLAPQVVPIAPIFPFVANDDVIDHHVAIAFNNGGGNVVVSALTVPAGTGTGGASPVNVSNGPWSSAAIPLPIAVGVAINWRVEEAVGAGKAVTLQMAVLAF